MSRRGRIAFRARKRKGVGHGASGQAGFAVVDAMIALAILSSTIVLSLVAIQTAHSASRVVSETRRARVELQYLLDNAPRALGVQSGRAGGFDWRVATQSAGDMGPSGARICNRTALAASG